jgi:phosphotransacetylase
MDELVSRWRARLAGAGSREPRVMLADGDDSRGAEAARELAATTRIRPVLLAERATPGEGVEVLSPDTARTDARIADALDEALAGHDVSPDDRARYARDPLYLGAAAVRAGVVDACVGGSARPTADVIRAGVRVIGLAAGVETVSSCFLMGVPEVGVVAYADCAVIPEPDAAQLADITVSTSQTFAALTGQKPVVAMLSFSTKGSADHPAVQRIREATELVRARSPELSVDGELQFDAAFAAAVAAHKAPDSPAAGHANVFIFPNLDAANIGYKITERLAGATAIGPLLQGVAAPFNDLSRGCRAEDIVGVALASAMQAASCNPERALARSPRLRPGRRPGRPMTLTGLDAHPNRISVRQAERPWR